MKLTFALLIVIIAGVMNGSYALTLKYMKKWPEETIWFVFSFVAFLIFPLVTVFILVPDVLNIVQQIPSTNITILIIGGLVFGAGQVCYSISYKYLGLGLNCVVNISIGTTCTALAGLVLKPSVFGSIYSYLQVLGIIVFISAIIAGAFAGRLRAKSISLNEESGCITVNGIKYVIIGIILSICAGIGVAFEGITYIMATPDIQHISGHYHIYGVKADAISWAIMYVAAWIPYMLYFLILNIKNRSFSSICSSGTRKYWLFLLFMGICYYLALLVFSQASLLIGGTLAPTVAWPLFMIFIILTMNFWGYFQGEWKNAGLLPVRLMKYSILLLIVAVVVFSISSLFLGKT